MHKTSQTSKTTKEQQRAAYALGRIQKRLSTGLSKDDVALLVGLPTMILTNGLGQTMAFLLSKSRDDRYRWAFEGIRDWLIQEVPALRNGAEDLEFLKRFVSLDQSSYLRAQRETLSVLSWARRYAKAFGPQQGGSGDETR